MIEFRNIHKTYDRKPIVEDISFTIKKGELVVLIGPSGCGKTTLLKMINRLIKPTKGEIFINDVNIETRNEIELRREIGYVIQQTGLFPHMTVRQNINIIPRLEKMDKDEIENKCVELMEMVDLDAAQYLDRFPSQLSGGQQQRIGVARAFACNPEIILMDEPFSALDPVTREQLQDELVSIQAEYKKTIVFVTHDMSEAIKIADRICVLSDGKIQQYDKVEALMKRPKNDFVFGFIGKNRIWSAPEHIKVEDVMITDPVCSAPDRSILRCLEKMRLSKIDHILLTDKKKRLLGILSAATAQGVADKSVPASEVMRTEFIHLEKEQPMTEALAIVEKEQISTIPVLEDGIIIGLVTRSSLLTALSSQFIDDEREEDA